MTSQHTQMRNKRSARRKPPFMLRMLRLGFKSLGPILPGLAARYAYHIWFMTRRHTTPAREQVWLQQADTRFIDTPVGSIATYHWGHDGPLVYLVHGWNGRGSQLAAFAAPLVERGYRVVSFDGPGHGLTPGANRTNLLRFSDALQSLVTQIGPAEAIIAHSFGVAAMAYSLNNLNLKTNRVIAISTPSQMYHLAEYFFQSLRIPKRVQQHFVKMVEQEFGPDLWQRISPHTNVPALGHIPALLLHDKDDHDVPVAEGQYLHSLWPNSQYVQTEGLGHRRILRNQKVREQIIEFLTA